MITKCRLEQGKSIEVHRLLKSKKKANENMNRMPLKQEEFFSFFQMALHPSLYLSCFLLGKLCVSQFDIETRQSIDVLTCSTSFVLSAIITNNMLII